MNILGGKRKILLAGLLVCVIGLPCATPFCSAECVWRVQHQDFFPWCWMYDVRDSELHENHTDEKLRLFFSGCTTPREFYDRIQAHVLDSYREIQYTDLAMNEQRLPVIVDTLTSNETVYLFCHHQALVFVAGVKAMFSTYDEQQKRYVLNDSYGEFSLEIWRSWDFHPPIFPYRSHVQLVIDTWNGTEQFTIENVTFERLETDNWEDEYRGFNKYNDCFFYPFSPAKRNSRTYTDE